VLKTRALQELRAKSSGEGSYRSKPRPKVDTPFIQYTLLYFTRIDVLKPGALELKAQSSGEGSYRSKPRPELAQCLRHRSATGTEVIGE
jgi:hypothetical protein